MEKKTLKMTSQLVIFRAFFFFFFLSPDRKSTNKKSGLRESVLILLAECKW